MNQHTTKSIRIVSLDIFRGITMFLLMAEGAGLYHGLNDLNTGGFFRILIDQFYHHPWHGIRFWDLIQPFFMFIVGVAMPFSYKNRLMRGDSRKKISFHIIKRCIILLLFGILLHCGFNKKLVFELWNVLAQLSFTIMVAYIIMQSRLRVQFGVSVLLLILSDLLYRFTNVNGFNETFVMGKNFGSYIDTVLMGKINPDGWVAINAIPTAAHTIWGVITGKILMNSWKPFKKLRFFIIAGMLFLLIGYTFDISGLSPVIKRICTTSFIFISGGWTILCYAFCYWIADINKITRWAYVFILFGMNPIFIYMLSNTLGYQWLNDFLLIFTKGFFQLFHLSVVWIKIINSLFILVLESLLLYYMFKKTIFIKI